MIRRAAAKPMIDWDDEAAREALIDSRAKDGYACLLVLEAKEFGPEVTQAATLLATVVGQDIEVGDDGVLRIARRVTQDRVISTIDPEARHGHKTRAKASMATRATRRSTPTQRSSPRPS